MVIHGSAMAVHRTSWCPTLFVIILLINKSDDCYKLIKIWQNLKKKLDNSYQVFIFIKKQQQLSWQNVGQRHVHMTSSVHFHRHDMIIVPLTVLLHCPITSMICTLYYSAQIRLVITNHIGVIVLINRWKVIFSDESFFSQHFLILIFMNYLGPGK